MEAKPQSGATTTAVDPYKHLDIVLNPDGSLSRNSKFFPNIPPAPTPVITRDIIFNQSNQTGFRIYLPTHTLNSDNPKLPVIFYIRGGGFVLFSAATSVFNVFCTGIATHLPAIVISIDHRLAPEHRLPAAYDDSMEALLWIQTNWADVDWLRDHADFSNCFFMGTSAGANIAYHLGLRLTATATNLKPLNIIGLILHAPFFGGMKRTKSELTHVNDLFLRPGVTDLLWELSLPIGSDRDHEYCNIRVGVGPTVVGKIGWKVLVTDFQGDPLYDHAVDVVAFLREKGLDVVVDFPEGGYHAADLFDPYMAKPFHAVLKTFVSDCVCISVE